MTKTKTIDSRRVRLRLVDGTTVNGHANINKDPGYGRLSDLITNKEEQFLTLINATSYQADIEQPVKHPVLLINKRHIVWAAPDEGEK